LHNLTREARLQLPLLARTTGHLRTGFRGADRIEGKTRLLVQLRMARLMGCPVCVNLFPPLAARAGYDKTAIESALEGRADGLTPSEHAAVAWTGELVTRDGEVPTDVPAEAQSLSDAQRDHLAFVTRLELVVHATGLMFLPHGWIERAARG
jgi:AhpD family alkylhydroperoxidase